MRLPALIPVLLCAAALVLSFLCLFAGSKRGFMDDYSILTLNTSRIGASFLNASHSSSNPLISFVDNATNSVENTIKQDISSVARTLGIHDFYNVHILDFCEGYYTPGPVPNTTLPRSQIHRNVTSCSNRTAMYSFDPRTTLQQELNASGHGNVALSDLNWPSDVDRGLHALVIAQKATFVLYCVAIALIGVATLLALASLFAEGRLSAFVNVLVDWLAFLAIGLASAIATAVAVKAVDVINKYGDHIGAQASTGSKFLVLTWVATAVMLVASIVWCFECIVGRKEVGPRSKKGYTNEPQF
ncbi:hypothetical protein LTR91_007285 [Friedmanniomyces endolithicus]|uniref:MARVEL domain-containing protein n=1 Tax=Friedmanniomyces endolithicus TaxID=329885 RepID=A0AAN6KPW7_9PEZI|nr:hypothetical protein LTR94_002826 [Friedmanniomyces endolithicus]KAK0800211.1 hypothetical protein LTR75_009005 [Friedmanniomyces endolithicus]KAK0805672.1 hypothetical protein LTR59_003894 [Friedmanniomyces endolithicus]KAK0809837.1 hypothetical protein LTR38_004167 [Friedmanniomyces endolithicus]KAK0881235.1 hypothetical protein LTR87_004967 [Friedmanniomyces endolithicus]